MADQGKSELLLPPSRLKWMVAFSISAVLALGGVWMLSESGLENRLMGWLAVGIFSLGIVVSVIAMIPNASYLRLTHRGFTVRSMWREYPYRWTDVVGFQVFQIGRRNTLWDWPPFARVNMRMVGFNFSSSYTANRRGRTIAKHIAGFEGAVPENYSMAPEKLAQLLNAWRQSYLSDIKCGTSIYI